MTSSAASWRMLLATAAAEVAVDSQRWILVAMQKNGEKIMTMLWRILGNEQDVCDAYQDTFLQLAHWQGGQKPDNVRAFVFRTASNTAVSILRRRKVHDKACRAIAEETTEFYSTQVGGDLDANQLRETLRTYITRLPEQLRSVILLRDLAEMPYSQVASIMGISVASARVYRCRAVQLLSAWMARKKEFSQS